MPATPSTTAPIDPTQARVPGLLRRLATMLYDLLLLTGVLVVAAALVVLPVGDIGPGLPRLAFQLYLLAVIGGYYLYFWTGGRQSLGMRAWRTLLLRADGTPPRAADALRRLVFASLTLAPAGLGLWWCLFDRDGLTWYDRLSATRPVLLARPGRR